MRYAILFIPFLLAYLLMDTPTVSYAVSWTGSIFILWMSLSGRVRRIPSDRPLAFQLFRPIVFTQLIFACYTALTSILYFVSVLRGTTSALNMGGQDHLLSLIAEAQSYYVLAHASMVTGILLAMNYRDSGRYQLAGRYSAGRFLLALSAIAFALSFLARLNPGLSEATVRLGQLAIVASVFSFALSLINRDYTHIWLNAVVFLANLLSALRSGWKEQLLILLLLFFAALFPYYRRATIAMAAIAMGFFIAIIPAYTRVYRDLAWYGDLAPTEAMGAAIGELRSGRLDPREATREFLVLRLSEIHMFAKYLDNIPEKRPFYETQILSQSLTAMIPRALWSGKPNLEKVVMERVYENGLYSRVSRISAKPQYVVDAYLTGGIPVIFVACLIFGMLASLMSRLAERWFGGYTMGSGLVYGALFQIFWRGNSFEFFTGTLTWSLIMMTALFFAGRRLKLLVATPLPNVERCE